jgi:hypothetical protein
VTLLAPPVSAIRVKGATVVTARERTGSGWVLARYFDNAPADPSVSRLATLSDAPELVAASGDVGLVSREQTDAGSRRVLYRLEGSGDAGARVGEPTQIGDAICGTLDSVYWVEREGSGFKGWRRAIGEADAAPVAGPVLTSQSEVTLVCSEHQAFLATNVEGQVRVVTWSAEATSPASSVRQVMLPKPPLSGAPDDLLMSAMSDGLVLVALDSKAMAAALFRPGQPVTRWQSVKLPSLQGLSLEAIEPEANKIGLLLLRTVAPAKECRKDDANDTVAELAIFDLDASKLVRAPERVETWRCGAEPGPFFSGWASGKFVVGWPRGADAACARARVHWGGLGFGRADPGGAHVQVERVSSPADTIAEAGCDQEKCYAVALTRGAEPCGPADGPEVGKAEIIAYP